MKLIVTLLIAQNVDFNTLQPYSLVQHVYSLGDSSARFTSSSLQ